MVIRLQILKVCVCTDFVLFWNWTTSSKVTLKSDVGKVISKDQVYLICKIIKKPYELCNMCMYLNLIQQTSRTSKTIITKYFSYKIFKLIITEVTTLRMDVP